MMAGIFYFFSAVCRPCNRVGIEKIIPILLIYLLGALCVGSFGMLVFQAVKLSSFTKTDAQIIGYMPDGAAVGSYVPILLVHLPNGESMQVNSLEPVDATDDVGAIIGVYLDPQAPNYGAIPSNFLDLWLGKLLLFGFCLLVTGGYAFGVRKGRALLQQTAILAPDAEIRVRAQRGHARFQAQDFGGAAAEWSAVLEQQPSGLIHEWRGDAYARLGNRNDAAADYSAAAQLYQKTGDSPAQRRALAKAATSSS